MMGLVLDRLLDRVLEDPDAQYARAAAGPREDRVTPMVLALAAGAANLAGALVVVRGSRRGARTIEGAIAFGAGFMVSVVMLSMLPEAFASGPGAAPWVLGGFLAVHLAQHVLTPHFHFGEETHHVTPGAGASAVIGLSLHTFFDGVAIASGLLVSPGLGALLFLAVFLHKLPEGLTVASLVLASGQVEGACRGPAARAGRGDGARARSSPSARADCSSMGSRCRPA